MDEQLLERLKRWCALRERANLQVHNKLVELGVAQEDTEEYITVLTKQDFLNEKRYAGAFAHDKFEFNNWGRIKIRQELTSNGVSSHLIGEALQVISVEKYRKTIAKLIESKAKRFNQPLDFNDRKKVIRYLANKGFELDLILKNFD